MSEPIGYWMGEPISEMSRERLLEVVAVLGQLDRQKDLDHDRHVTLLEDIVERPAPPSFAQMFWRRVKR